MTTVLSPARASAATPRCGNCGGELVDGRCPRCSPPGGVAPAGIDGEYWSAPPARFQHYEIEREEDGRLRELGRGGMGVTYLARDLNLGRQVVLKFIRPELFSNPSVERRFLHEARLAARLHHQNIATVLYLGQEGRRWFYAMEWVPGDTLDQLVKCSGRLSDADTLEIVRQVAHALAEAERMQLVHRDIKPSNVMVQRAADGRLHAKVIDFGLAKLLEPGEGADATMHTQDGMLGTPHYASPEQLREEKVDIRSDFYSLGATAWFALTGRTLYEGSRAAVVAQHLQPPKGAPLSHFHSVAMSRHWIELLSALLALRADDRPTNSAALIALIEGGSTQGLSRWRNAVRYARPNTKRLAAAAILLALGGVAWHFWPRSPSPAEASLGNPASVTVAAPLQNGDMALTSAAELVTRGDSFRRRLTTADNEYAIALYLRAIHLDRTFAPAHAMLASSYSQRYLRFGFGREWLVAAAAEAQRAHDLDPASATGLRALGGVRYAEGRLAEAAEYYGRALALNPDDANLLQNFAGISRDRGELEKAHQLIERAVALRPKESSIWSFRGNIEKLRENDALALSYYEEASRLAPATAEPRLGVAHVFYLNRRFEEAAKTVDEAEDLSGDIADVLCLRAQVLLHTGALREAEANLRRALTIKRTGNPYYYGQVRFLGLLGWLRCKLGAGEEGRQLLEESLQLDKDELQAGTESGDIRYSMAATLFALNRDELGFQAIEDAINHGWRSVRSATLDRRLDGVRERVNEIFRRAAIAR